MRDRELLETVSTRGGNRLVVSGLSGTIEGTSRFLKIYSPDRPDSPAG